VLIGIDSVS